LSAARLRHRTPAAARVPALWAANFSLGVAVLSELVRRAAGMLPGWDCDIVESHHVHKRDAPSGTALALGRAVEAGGGREPHYASLRAGDIVGEHLVQFTGLGERIELAHRAQQRDIFARGALEVGARLARAATGRHTIASLLLG
jgi:4-hydroxy-tetrahydrodipicolinate reductase